MNVRGRRWGRWLAALIAIAGLSQLALGLWIPAKAALAQALLQRAWTQTVASGAEARPWPWADTWPVAKLSFHGRDFIVLAAAGGEALAFGPSHVAGTARPGAAGISVLSGHRDTHFRDLRTLAVGDLVTVTRPDGAIRHYRVMDTAVLDRPELALPRDPGGDHLLLVTCWPFDAALPGGPERYLVWAAAAND